MEQSCGVESLDVYYEELVDGKEVGERPRDEDEMGEVDEALREVGRHDRARAACLPADVAAVKGFEISYI